MCDSSLPKLKLLSRRYSKATRITSETTTPSANMDSPYALSTRPSLLSTDTLLRQVRGDLSIPEVKFGKEDAFKSSVEFLGSVPSPSTRLPYADHFPQLAELTSRFDDKNAMVKYSTVAILLPTARLPPAPTTIVHSPVASRTPAGS